MFTLDATIDAVQTGKKQFVKTFVQNETISSALNDFVDAQTAYTKDAVKAITDMFTVVAKESVTALQNAAKFDIAKFNEGVVKAYNQTAKK